ncbi:MAG: hypothetical protein ACQESG_07330 [Nanobdellota archaeon]
MKYLLAVLLVPIAMGQILISGVNYNPTGADDGHEWVEIHNDGDAVSLANVTLETGNGVSEDSWTWEWTGGTEVLGKDEYLLIGEEAVVPTPDIVTNLDLQNGPDGVRVRGPAFEDVVGWGEHQFSEYYEGSPAPEDEGPLVRTGADSDDNSVDFAYDAYLPHSQLSKRMQVTVTSDAIEITNVSFPDDLPSEGVQLSPSPGKTRHAAVSFTVRNCNGTNITTVPSSDIQTIAPCRYRAELDIPYSMSPGMYSFDIWANQRVNMTINYEVLSLRAFDLDTPAVEFTHELRGDTDMATDMRPTISNIGNVPLSIRILSTGLLSEEMEYKVTGYAWFSLTEQHELSLDVEESLGLSLRADGSQNGEILVVAQ